MNYISCELTAAEAAYRSAFVYNAFNDWIYEKGRLMLEYFDKNAHNVVKYSVEHIVCSSDIPVRSLLVISHNSFHNTILIAKHSLFSWVIERTYRVWRNSTHLNLISEKFRYIFRNSKTPKLHICASATETHETPSKCHHVCYLTLLWELN